MKAWAEFYPDSLPELPGVPLVMLDHWLRQTAIEFCERSRAYVVELAPIDAVAGQMAYPLTLPAETDLVEVVGVEFADEPLDPRAPGELRREYGNWRAEIGTPQAYTQRGLDALLLVPAPAAAAAAAIVVEAALKPAAAATGIADWVFTRWREPLVAGVKAKLMAMADRPWTQPDRVPLYAGQFEAAIASATTAANAGFVRSRPRARGVFC